MEGQESGRRVTMQEAADELGLTVEAIRKRIQRGSMRSDKGEDGRRYVYLDESHPEVHVETTEVVEELRDRVRSLERMLDEERGARTEERRRHDTLMAQLMQRIPELEPPASPQEPRGSPESTEPSSTPPESTAGPQAGAQRPWWRRIIGG